MTVSADGLPETAATPGAPSPPPGLVVVGHFDQPPGYGVDRPRGADSWLFTWTTGGRGRLRQGRAEARAGEGDLVVLAPGAAHGYGVEPGAPHWEFWWAHCQARPTWRSWLRPYDAGEGLYVVTPTPVAVRGRVEAAFRRMLADARWTGTEAPPAPAAGEEPVAVAHGAAARELALCSLEEVVLLTAGTARPASPRPGVDARVRRAQALIDADPAAPHTVRSLAEHVALSPSRFAHLFTGQLGQSPMGVLREARLRHAARLLESTGLSVERVAAASGFASPPHFNRVFRERYGRPPGAYRSGGPMVGA
ncbi:helix-turn-helix domain-containing protein [Streptomyces sp. uw30]|uniref:helix-turn-helix domain-containing protein n=1 Tax=Streptomyces sp. uw30 TaxID=1828179 RepID=UPI0011CE3FBA|nr:helix-turn-helix domain-containing protein [Streptomyces sp. uw30]TXS43170.1 helix-turn-helix domain-containing protein [Streptomyces sp. uw30]